jgi:error-prone DNA polymerase
LASLPIHPGVAPGTRRAALWQAEAALRRPPGLFSHVEPSDDETAAAVPAQAEDARTGTSAVLPEMTIRERTAADLRGTGIVVGPHPVALERHRLRELGVKTAAQLRRLRNGQRVRAGGLCIVRQRPGTAKGFVFLSLEDETGISNIVIDPPTFERHRRPVLGSSLLVVEGRLERADGVTSVKGDRFWSLSDALPLPSRDFR